MSSKLIFLFVIGTLFHIGAFALNDVLKVADSFAYLQMSHYIGHADVRGLGTGWFGFLYSLPIALGEIIISDPFIAGKIVNIILFNISAVLLYLISMKFLSEMSSIGVVLLFFLSPILLHFNIHILSENIYIPLFLLLVYQLIPFMQFPSIVRTIVIAVILGCMYLTRAEAFIYLLSICIIALYLLKIKILTTKKFFSYGAIFLCSFFIFISPYLLHLHNITGEWGLTNKGASNLRQAELRGIEKMDDGGFERAVAELTSDKHHLIAGFAGGMKYDTPQIEGSLGTYIFQDPLGFFTRVLKNQKKLFTENLPEIFLGKSLSLFFGEDSRFKGNYFFLILCLIPVMVLLYGIYRFFKDFRDFFIIGASFFIPAFLFFTLFFTLNRYFLIFLPFFLMAFVYGAKEIQRKALVKTRSFGSYNITPILFINLIVVFSLSNMIYYNTEKEKDSYYVLKKEAGEWLRDEYSGNSLEIMERFPIVTYYSESKTRWITPYEEETDNIIKYALYNNINILVVDTMDFLTYRPFLEQYLEETPKGMTLLKEFTNTKNQKVILYEFQK